MGTQDDLGEAEAARGTALVHKAACNLPPHPGEPGPCDDAINAFADAWEAAQEATDD